MTQEEKQLLLKDLCARLSFGVILDNPNPCGEHWDELISMDIPQGTVTLLYDGRTYKVEKIKPYLRPMSSMTDEEETLFRCELPAIAKTDAQLVAMRMELFLKGHLDFNHLIEKGLALVAPEGMY